MYLDIREYTLLFHNTIFFVIVNKVFMDLISLAKSYFNPTLNPTFFFSISFLKNIMDFIYSILFDLESNTASNLSVLISRLFSKYCAHLVHPHCITNQEYSDN